MEWREWRKGMIVDFVCDLKYTEFKNTEEYGTTTDVISSRIGVRQHER